MYFLFKLFCFIKMYSVSVKRLIFILIIIISCSIKKIQYVPGLRLQEGKKLFLILRKNFRGITFFAHFKLPFPLLKSLFQHRGRLNIKLKKKYFLFFF
jgi:hypothetical protein